MYIVYCFRSNAFGKNVNNFLLDLENHCIYVYGEDSETVEAFIDNFASTKKLLITRTAIVAKVAAPLDKLKEQFDNLMAIGMK